MEYSRSRVNGGYIVHICRRTPTHMAADVSISAKKGFWPLTVGRMQAYADVRSGTCALVSLCISFVVRFRSQLAISDSRCVCGLQMEYPEHTHVLGLHVGARGAVRNVRVSVQCRAASLRYTTEYCFRIEVVFVLRAPAPSSPRQYAHVACHSLCFGVGYP